MDGSFPALSITIMTPSNLAIRVCKKEREKLNEMHENTKGREIHLMPASAQQTAMHAAICAISPGKKACVHRKKG